jgi:hypothetical protein
LLLTGTLILGSAVLIYSIGLPAPPVASTALARTQGTASPALGAVDVPAATVVDALVARARSTVADESAHEPVRSRMETLILSLASACRDGRAEAIQPILGEIRDVLAEEDPDAERCLARAVHAGGPGATELHYLAARYPNYERRRTLRARLAEAAPPAPAAHPDYHDAGAVAAYLRGSHPSDEKVKVLNKLSAETLRQGPVRECLVEAVLRSERGGAVAATSLRLLRRGPREDAEQVALRALDESPSPAVRRSAVRLLGAVAGPDGTERLVTIVRDSASEVERRLAADALIQRPLDATAVSILGQVAEDGLEDDHLRQHAIRALLAELKRSGPAAGAARAALCRVYHSPGLRSGPEGGFSSTIRLLEGVVGK